MHVDLHLLVADALDLDTGYRPADKLGAEVVADLGVLHDLVGVVLLGIPARLPVGDDAEAEAVRVDLLTHYSSSSKSWSSDTTIVM